MRSQILIALIAAAITGASSIAMAKGGGGGGGGKGGGHFHGRFDHRFSRNHFLRNQNVLSNWWGWGWGWGGYNDNGYGNAATVVVFPQAKPQAADVTGSTSGPCHFEADSFNVPSEAGGTRAVQVVACR